MTGSAARIVFASMALAYLVLLTGRLGFGLLMLPAVMPNGWPADSGKVQTLQASFALLAVLLVSTGVAWCLTVGFAARGREWVARRAWWLKAAALIAPILIVAGAAAHVLDLRALQSSEAGRQMPAIFWHSSWRHAWLQIAASLLFLPPVLYMAWPRRGAEA